MSYWYESPDSQKDGWHWLGLAIATLEGIASTDTIYRHTNQRQWKRIWWSCYIQDRLISLGTRRPTRLNNISFHVDMLQESDFDITRLENGCVISPEIPTFMRDVEMQKQGAAIFISLAQLCVCLEHVLQARYSLVSPLENDNQSVTMLYPKEPHHVNHDEVDAVEGELMSWAVRLPLCCRYMSIQLLESADESPSMVVRRMFLHILFYTALAVLHRAYSSQAQAPSKAYDAAIQISLMVQYLHQEQLEKLLPSTAVTSILTASMVYLTETINGSGQFQALYAFKMNENVLKELSQVYVMADHAIIISKAAIGRVGTIDEH